MGSDDRSAWTDAVCVTATGIDWFADPGSLQELEAKQACAKCRHRDGCLDLAVTHHEPLGVWGGTDPVDRWLILHGPDLPAGVNVHGNPNAWWDLCAAAGVATTEPAERHMMWCLDCDQPFYADRHLERCPPCAQHRTRIRSRENTARWKARKKETTAT